MTYALSPARDRRNTLVLVLAQAILGAQMPMIFTIGGLAGQMLSPNACLATLPLSFIILGSVLTAQPLSRFMARRGRRAGFILANLAGALGAALCALALFWGSFALFTFGALFTGIYMSSQGFYRFAATDTASPEFAPKAISYVMAGGLVAALLGPQLVKLTAQATLVPFMASYLVIIALNALGPVIFAFLDIPRPEPADRPDHPQGRRKAELLRDPVISVSIICAMVSFALMNLVMTSSPLAVVGCGFSANNAADIVSAHVLAMYVPSFFTGHLIARFGARAIVGTGLAVLVGAGLVALSGVELAHFFGALILLGIGWNFGFIGATAMLAKHHAVEERATVQGLNDSIVFGGVFLASLSSGGLMNCLEGGNAQAGWQAVNLAMIPLVALAGGALVWLTLRYRGRA